MYQIIVKLNDGTKIVKAKNLRFLDACDRLKVELDKATKNPLVSYVDMQEYSKN